MPGSSGNPVLAMTVGGSAYDMVANRVSLHTLRPFARDDAPSLEWSVPGGPVGTTLADDFRGQIVTLTADEGSGAVLWFAGRCEHGPTTGYDTHLGWVRSYTAVGLIGEGNRVPVTSPLDGTDAIAFNADPASADYRPALSGRSVGQIVRYVLEGTKNATALKALGVGGYATLPTLPATAHATVSGGHVTIVIDDGGSGYSGGSPPTIYLYGGGGTFSSPSVTVSGGAITAASVTSSSYTSPPEVWISTLPSSTLADLGALTIVPPYPITIQGERILQALSDQIRASQPNHFLHVLPDGTIRVYDQRTFSATTLTLNSTNPTDPKVDVGSLAVTTSTRDCYPRVVVRGGPDAVAVTLSTATTPGGLSEDFGHDGLSNTDAKNYWTLDDFIQAGDPSGRATIAAIGVNTSGAISSLTLGQGGYGYPASSSVSVTISAPDTGGTQAVAHGTTDASGHMTSTITITTAGSHYDTVPVTATFPIPEGTNRDSGTCTCPNSTTVRVTSSDTSRTWAADYWDQTSTGRHGSIWLVHGAGSGIDVRFSAAILSHGSLSAGGTCDITIAGVLPATNYDHYEIYGTAGGAADVWRKYAVDSTYAGKLLMRFPRPVAMVFASGTAGTTTSTPVGMVRVTSGAGTTETPVPIEVDPDANVIRFSRPVVLYSEPSYDTLKAGGAAVTAPAEVRAFLPVMRGSLSVVSPADIGGVPQYSGTSHTTDGLARTLTVTFPSWIDGSNAAGMQALADDLLDSVKDTTIEGSVSILGWASTWFTPGKSVQFSATGWTSPWSAIAAPVIECVVRFRPLGGSKYITTLRFSNRRQHFTAAQFLRPTPTGQIIGYAGGGDGAFDTRLSVVERAGLQLFRQLGTVESINAAIRDWANQLARGG